MQTENLLCMVSLSPEPEAKNSESSKLLTSKSITKASYLATNKRYRIKHAAQIRVRKQEYYRKNRNQIREKQRANCLRTLYGITIKEYEIMLEQQNGVCFVCGTPPKNTRLHVDHSHTTGKVRSLLCHRCNRHTGLIESDPDLYRKMFEYLGLNCQISVGLT